jgi:hypothetical protein
MQEDAIIDIQKTFWHYASYLILQNHSLTSEEDPRSTSMESVIKQLYHVNMNLMQYSVTNNVLQKDEPEKFIPRTIFKWSLKATKLNYEPGTDKYRSKEDDLAA